MKLTDLEPRWLKRGETRVGFAFRSPIHLGRQPAQIQTCFFSPTPSRDQYDFEGPLEAIYGEDASIQFCEPACGWTPTPAVAQASFETISVTPSLDGSRGGNWHGYITNGQIVGGI